MRGRLTRPTGWLSYDSVAETYERVAVPWFAPMARDLITAIGLPPGGCVLDAGTGTGLAADLAGAAIGSRGFVVGIDPSIGMLQLARDQRRIPTVAAMAPGLPFPDACFDAVIANLVISHLPDLVQGLADMVRVLRHRGRLGVTAWGPDPAHTDDQGGQADAIVASVRESCRLPSDTPVKGAPWEQQLRSRAQLCETLAGAGLRHPDAQLHTYRRTFMVDDYLSGWGGLARYLRSEQGEQRWRDFSNRAAAKLHEQLGDTIVSVKQAWVATGTAR